METLELPLTSAFSPKPKKPSKLFKELMDFKLFGQPTRLLHTPWQDAQGNTFSLPTFVNEYWTAKQRAAHSLHEISYRACFKPQLPRFFIERLTRPGETVYDPFMGRGTTLLEAALMNRVPAGGDVNPLCTAMIRPRLNPPSLPEIESTLDQIDFEQLNETPEDLLVFYHPDTLRQLSSLRQYLLTKEANNELDVVDDWIRMVALNRLTGHSPGFFSVYTLPPNQAVSVKSQRKINERRQQTPPFRNVPGLILKKSRQLLKDLADTDRTHLSERGHKAILLTALANNTQEIPDHSVALVVTSPPFLDVVDYAGDNWLRCWFLGIEPASVRLTTPRKREDWQAVMITVFKELHRILKSNGHIAFEVGEVDGGKVKLEDNVIPAGTSAGLQAELVLINDQEFTKTANCWGVANGSKGTNTNRIVLFRKP